jgi:hypothetical protein
VAGATTPLNSPSVWQVCPTLPGSHRAQMFTMRVRRGVIHDQGVTHRTWHSPIGLHHVPHSLIGQNKSPHTIFLAPSGLTGGLNDLPRPTYRDRSLHLSALLLYPIPRFPPADAPLCGWRKLSRNRGDREIERDRR